ncbi:MAG TPA: laccase domain-containing protein [Longimicrobiales bacterium]|nr:laccase domain-containing protein [Longimicrobiales bacterium]
MLPLYAHPEWAERFPWLVQGTTGRGEPGDAFDFRLFGDTPSGVLIDRWRRLREATGCAGSVHARQVHGAEVLVHRHPVPGLLVAERYDGHATREPGVLLTVSVADCVPISLVDGERRAVALLHGGWRGVAAGVLEQGITALRAVAGAAPADLWVHLGPAICGECYEVGPEVFSALGLPEPAANTPIDLRAVLVRRAAAAGVAPARISVSEHCTRCGAASFYSHRAGCAERQLGLLGVRPARP